jgi:predicted N-acetyltransferase YhbS
VHHVGVHAQLEDQMTSFVADIDRGKIGSPDRVDALVWAMTELIIQKVPFEFILALYRRETANYLLLDNIAVSPARQGLGLGRRLLAFGEPAKAKGGTWR